MVTAGDEASAVLGEGAAVGASEGMADDAADLSAEEPPAADAAAAAAAADVFACCCDCDFDFLVLMRLAALSPVLSPLSLSLSSSSVP